MVTRRSKVDQIKVPKWAKSEYRNQHSFSIKKLPAPDAVPIYVGAALANESRPYASFSLVGVSMAQKQFVNLDQLVQMFPFLKRSRVYYLTTVKRIPFYRVGRSLVFEVSEIQEWIESGRVMPQET